MQEHAKKQLENLQSQIDARLKNAQELAETARNRNRKKRKRLKEEVADAQKQTDQANAQLREVENELDSLKTRAASLPQTPFLTAGKTELAVSQCTAAKLKIFYFFKARSLSWYINRTIFKILESNAHVFNYVAYLRPT